MKKVIITGVSGQDGSYMVDYLLENTNHQIYGVVRRSSNPNLINIKEALKNDRFKLVTADLSDSPSINKIVKDITPDYFINLAAQSFVGSSWQIPEQTMDVNSSGVLRCIEAIKEYYPKCRFYNAGSSEEFGDVQYSPQDEKHPLRARSPYGASKIAAQHIVKTYRESYNLYAIQGLLYNHESPRRGEEFVTRKITKGVARIKYALDNNLPFEPIELGNLDAKRDWSHAKDFVEGIWKMLNQDIYRVDWEEQCNQAEYHGDNDLISYRFPQDIKEYILSSNETHSIREFVELAFKYIDVDAAWILGKKPEDEILMKVKRYPNTIVSDGCLIKVNPKFYRPAEVDLLLGDSSLARKELGWKPKYSFNQLVKEMVESDIKNYQI